MRIIIVSLDTGTVRPGLEKSTYKLRRAVSRANPLSHPDQAARWAVHDCRIVDGIADGPFPG